MSLLPMTRYRTLLAAGLCLTACAASQPTNPEVPPLTAEYLAGADSGVTTLGDLRLGDRLWIDAQSLGCFSAQAIQATITVDSSGEWVLAGRAGFGGPAGFHPQAPLHLSPADREGLDHYFALLRPGNPNVWCSSRELLTLVLLRDGRPVRREVIDNTSCPAAASGQIVTLDSLFRSALAQAEAAQR